MLSLILTDFRDFSKLTLIICIELTPTEVFKVADKKDVYFSMARTSELPFQYTCMDKREMTTNSLKCGWWNERNELVISPVSFEICLLGLTLKAHCKMKQLRKRSKHNVFAAPHR